MSSVAAAAVSAAEDAAAIRDDRFPTPPMPISARRRLFHVGSQVMCNCPIPFVLEDCPVCSPGSTWEPPPVPEVVRLPFFDQPVSPMRKPKTTYEMYKAETAEVTVIPASEERPAKAARVDRAVELETKVNELQLRVNMNRHTVKFFTRRTERMEARIKELEAELQKQRKRYAKLDALNMELIEAVGAKLGAEKVRNEAIDQVLADMDRFL